MILKTKINNFVQINVNWNIIKRKKLFVIIVKKEFFINKCRIKIEGKKYCSHKCWENDHREYRICEECGKEFSIRKSESKKRSGKFCSKNVMGYGFPNIILGRRIIAGEVVHHFYHIVTNLMNVERKPHAISLIIRVFVVVNILQKIL